MLKGLSGVVIEVQLVAMVRLRVLVAVVVVKYH